MAECANELVPKAIGLHWESIHRRRESLVDGFIEAPHVVQIRLSSFFIESQDSRSERAELRENRSNGEAMPDAIIAA